MANSSSGEAVLDRSVRVLRAFDAAHPSLGVAEIAARAELPRTTAYRLVAQLAEHGLLEHVSDGRYRPGVVLWEVATRASAPTDLSTAALPFLEDVNQVVRHSVQLSILDDSEVLVLERLSRPGHAINQAHRASRLPVHRSSMGLVLLAHAADRERAEYLRRHGEAARATHPRLEHTLETVRLQGFAVLDGFIDAETTGIAVPVLGPKGRLIAALGVVVPVGYDAAEAAVMSLRTASRGLARALATPRS
ncbi:IclR family transcriptional regulator [Galactobacter valiniphilus]|uniref:IclR family transcriptional regulator n=1 Tax=Galactobacter valiniphilus TaxID=2676122 RepID=UPI00373663C3